MNSKKIIMAMISVLIIIVIILGILIIMNLKQQNPTQTENTLNNNVSSLENKSIQKVTDKSKFYTVTNCVYQYLSEVNKNNSKYYTTNEDEDAEEKVKEKVKGNILRILEETYEKYSRYMALIKA